MNRVKPIQVWAYSDAPRELRELSRAGGDEDWIAVVSSRYQDYYVNWLEVPSFGVNWVDHFRVKPDGAVSIRGRETGQWRNYLPADEKRAVTLTHPASGESFIFRSFAYLRCRGKRIVGRGDLVAFVVRDGGAGASATLSLNGRERQLMKILSRYIAQRKVYGVERGTLRRRVEGKNVTEPVLSFSHKPYGLQKRHYSVLFHLGIIYSYTRLRGRIGREVDYPITTKGIVRFVRRELLDLVK